MIEYKAYFKIAAAILSIILFMNIFIFGIAGSSRVQAGFLDENKDGLLMVVKGIIMFWIINLMSRNNSGDNNESFLTTTIKNSLNLEENTENKKVGVTEKNNDNNNNEVSINVEKSGEAANENDIIIKDIFEEKEEKMLNLINVERVKKGLKKLEVDNSLTEIARLKAEDMVENDYFAHNSPLYGSPFDMLKAKGVNYGLAGENLAEANSISSAFEQLMQSPAHKDNILDKRYDKVGIAVIKGEQYEYMIVQLFIDLADPAI